MRWIMRYRDEEEFLNHYGIKGMRWGVRRKNPSGGTPKKDTGRDASLKSISNKDLQSRINRLNMEKNYKKLLKEAEEDSKSPVAKAISAGSKEVSRALVNAGKESIKNYASSKFQVALQNGVPAVAVGITSVAKAVKK